MALDILNKFTTNLKNTLVRAINLSIRLKHPKVLPLHLLISLSEQTGSVANEILEKNQLTTDLLQRWLERVQWPETQKLYTLPQLAPETIRILEHAAVVAFEHQHKYIGTEHLLLSLLELPDQLLEKIYQQQNLKLDALKKQTLTILKSTSRFPDLTALFREELTEVEQMKTTEQKTAQNTSTTPALDFFSTNLTEPKVQKTIDPVIGRSEEIDRLIHILSRRTKNNPVLLGEPGVGKTAIVEGLAKRILQRQVPSILLDKKIYRLDLGLVVAGTMYRG
ncbi:MAG: class III stress response-related ATPase, AAA+ superfamily, partial [uncultured bacterium]